MSEHPDPDRWWKKRRQMAWAGGGFSAASVAAGFILALIDVETFEAVRPMATSAMYAGLVPMVSYFGGCAVEALRVSK